MRLSILVGDKIKDPFNSKLKTHGEWEVVAISLLLEKEESTRIKLRLLHRIKKTSIREPNSFRR